MLGLLWAAMSVGTETALRSLGESWRWSDSDWQQDWSEAVIGEHQDMTRRQTAAQANGSSGDFGDAVAIIGQCSRANDSATDDRDEDRVSARSFSVTTSQTSEDIGADSKRTQVRVRLNDGLREAKRKESEAQRKFNRADAAIETAFERLISTDENTTQRAESLRELNEAESQQDAASRELMDARSLVCEAYIDIAGSWCRCFGLWTAFQTGMTLNLGGGSLWHRPYILCSAAHTKSFSN